MDEIRHVELWPGIKVFTGITVTGWPGNDASLPDA